MGIPQLPTDTAPGFVGLDVPGGERVDDGWVASPGVYICIVSVRLSFPCSIFAPIISVLFLRLIEEGFDIYRTGLVAIFDI